MVFHGKPFPWWKQEEGLQALPSPRPTLSRNVCVLVENINSEWFLGLVGSVLSCCHIELASKDQPLAHTPQRYPQASQCICTGKKSFFSPHTCHPFPLIYTSNIALLPSGMCYRHFLLIPLYKTDQLEKSSSLKMAFENPSVTTEQLLGSLSLTGLFSQGKFPNVSMAVSNKSFLPWSVAKPGWLL